MSKTGTTRVHTEPGKPVLTGHTDWERLHAMTDEEAMAAALSDPDAPPMTLGELAQMRPVPDIKALRARLGMTQEQFAEAYCVPSALCGIGRRGEPGRMLRP
jgi:putative transcriptional regulator